MYGLASDSSAEMGQSLCLRLMNGVLLGADANMLQQHPSPAGVPSVENPQGRAYTVSIPFLPVSLMHKAQVTSCLWSSFWLWLKKEFSPWGSLSCTLTTIGSSPWCSVHAEVRWNSGMKIASSVKLAHAMLAFL